MEQEELTATDGVRRRRWSIEDKRAIVELSLDPDCSITEIATSFDLQPNQIYAWRRELREMAEAEARGDQPMFLPAVIESEPMAPQLLEPDRHEGRLLPTELVQVAMGIRGVPVMVAHGASPALVCSVIEALKRAR